jgi:outer membrane protein
MKKSLFVCFLVTIVTTVSLKAQLFIGGGVNLNSKTSSSQSSNDNKVKTTSFNLTPRVGYYISDKTAFGLGVGLTTSKTTTPETEYSGEKIEKSNSWSFSPFVRYNLVQTGNFTLLSEGTIGLGGGKSTTTSGTNDQTVKRTFASINVKPIVQYSFSDKFLIETSLGGIGYSASKSKLDGQSGDGTKSSGINFGLGLDNLTVGAIYKIGKAAEASSESQNHTFDLGVGLGLDYGGIIGVKGSYILPIKQLSVFVAAGAQLLGFGWNVGTAFAFLPANDQRSFNPYVKFMYGINRSTKVSGKSEYNEMFTGFTPGIGSSFMYGKKKASGFAVDLNYPVGSSEYKAQMDEIENDPEVSSIMVLPVTISIGYHHLF